MLSIGRFTGPCVLPSNPITLNASLSRRTDFQSPRARCTSSMDRITCPSQSEHTLQRLPGAVAASCGTSAQSYGAIWSTTAGRRTVPDLSALPLRSMAPHIWQMNPSRRRTATRMRCHCAVLRNPGISPHENRHRGRPSIAPYRDGV